LVHYPQAAQTQRNNCVTVLLQNGADPNIKDKKGNTALHYAIYNENIKISTKLLEFKADTEIKNQVSITQL
jgi:ankyrin repeat protein